MMVQKVIRDNAKDMEDFCKDLQQWGIDMEKKENKEKSSEEMKTAKKPKVRKLNESKKKENVPKQAKKTTLLDYSAWEKFDVDAECAKIDESSDESALTDECDNSSVELANVEKEKGNNYVKKQEWKKAIEKYTAAIKLYTYDPVFYANRALCYLKLQKYELCQTDCNKALRLDPTYVKAFHRRAMALEALGHFTAAHDDLKSILKVEPNNKDTKNLLKKLETKIEEAGSKKNVSNEETQRPKSKFTMSRQKTEGNSKITELSTKAEPIKSHVVERKPTNSIIGNIIEKQEDFAVLSTSKANLIFPESTRQVDNSNSVFNKSKTANLNIKTKWPMGDDVELVQTIFKAPNQRSNKKLKRIKVVDLDSTILKTNQESLVVENTSKKIEEISTQYNEQKAKINQNFPITTQNDNLQKIAITNNNIKQNDDFINVDISVAPKTAVQFVKVWKALKDFQVKLNYLKVIDPTTFVDIFKESLSTDLFSQIIATLSYDEKKCISHYQYLFNLSKVKRFGALTMFMSKEDKKNLLILIDYMRDDVSLDQHDVDKLIKLYEM